MAVVDYKIDQNNFKIIAKAVPGVKSINAKWFTDDIRIVCSPDVGGTVVIDFSYSTSSIFQYTLNADAGSPTYVSINNNSAVEGGQSRFIRVTSGDVVNFRAATGGTLNRAVLGEL